MLPAAGFQVRTLDHEPAAIAPPPSAPYSICRARRAPKLTDPPDARTAPSQAPAIVVGSHPAAVSALFQGRAPPLSAGVGRGAPLQAIRTRGTRMSRCRRLDRAGVRPEVRSTHRQESRRKRYFWDVSGPPETVRQTCSTRQNRVSGLLPRG